MDSIFREYMVFTGQFVTIIKTVPEGFSERSVKDFNEIKNRAIMELHLIIESAKNRIKKLKYTDEFDVFVGTDKLCQYVVNGVESDRNTKQA